MQGAYHVCANLISLTNHIGYVNRIQAHNQDLDGKYPTIIYIRPIV